jgi:phospholipid/cholesterol/gamma-HCH transport system ATP-binding protein
MPADISGGMKKRAGLARAIVRNPSIILYDEPTSGLDPVMSARISDMIISMKSELGVTSVVVTHDMVSAYNIADRIAMLYNGSIIECGTPEQIRGSSSPIVRQFVEGSLIGPIEV